jgi:hypothetical protein
MQAGPIQKIQCNDESTGKKHKPYHNPRAIIRPPRPREVTRALTLASKPLTRGISVMTKPATTGIRAVSNAERRGLNIEGELVAASTA